MSRETTDISKIDPNFAARKVEENGFTYFDVRTSPFSLEGLPWFEENGRAFYRLPKPLTEKDVNAGALFLSNHTAGVCVRFRSDSPEIMIRSKLAFGSDMNHMPRAGSCGFDSYRKLQGGELLYNKTFQPNPGQVDVLALIGTNPDKSLCEWLVNFPLYGGVESVEIGIKEGASLLPPFSHKVKEPVLFYGSSITQGGCASRPGNAYTSMLCRAVDAPQINLGFSGSGKGEKAVARAIAGLDLSAFVMDYDHNAPNPEHLQDTHEPFFRIIREVCPELPVIFLSKCDFYGTEPEVRRRDIIRATFENALKSGDRNVYFIDGAILFGGKMRDSCTVDGCHPNDLGFYRMYKHTLPILKLALKNAPERNKTR